MAYPVWLTPAGNLGVVPELAYYQFTLDAYDTAGGTLTYAKVSGTLPPGIQLISTGILQGIPISTAGPDNNQTYTFTIRVQNTSDGLLADRSFSLTVTNIAPPIIVPRNVDLGTYYDGSIVNIQLDATEFILEDNLVWTLKDGTLPSGLTLSASGLISGYIQPMPVIGPGSDNDWDMAEWDEAFTIGGQSGTLAWDFEQGTISKSFSFNIQVTDGVNFDVSSYKLLVLPRKSYAADSTKVKADATVVNGGPLTADFGDRHVPIIVTTQTDILPERQGGWFAFKIDAIDLDDDTLQYAIPALDQGSFDEQVFVGNSIPYVAGNVVNGNISTAVTSLVNSSLPGLSPGAAIQVLYPYTDITTATTYLTWYNATVNHHTTVRLTGNTIVSGSAGDFITQIISGANATITNVSATTGTITLYGNVTTGNVAYANVGGIAIFANVGDYITQPSTSANATVISAHGSFNANTQNPYVLTVQYNSGTFTIGGNIQINGNWVNTYPTTVVCNTDVHAIYNTSSLFRLGVPEFSGQANIADTPTGAYPSTITSIGVILGAASTQGTIGFDESRFDQGTLQLPGTLSIDADSGWITGYLPVQTANETSYTFAVDVSKKDYLGYVASKLFTISVYGDLYNKVTWLTPSYLGSIENGTISDFSISAISTKGKEIYYYYTPGAYLNLPQGLRLQPDGLISGRVSFELFGLDQGATTFDADFYTGDPTTTFDHTFEFSITAQTFDGTASDVRVFTILVRGRNAIPYEDLYLKALLNQYQRIEFKDIVQDPSVFPVNEIYRSTDPWFGISKDIRTLFLPGLTPSTLETYTRALETNHFTKRLIFGNVKSAVAKADGVYDVIENNSGAIIGTYNIYTGVFVPTDYSLGYTVLANTIPSGTTIGDQHVKYEVVYAEILEENSNEFGQGPEDVINLAGVIANPYYDNGNTYVVATPNAFTNMTNAVTGTIDYVNKGALPDWMTSVQPNGAQLGFIRATVLAYVNPGYGETVAWRFNQKNYDLNELNFTVDRYLIDNVYSANYDIAANAYISSRETTFDRYPPLSGIFKYVATVDYAVNTAFEEIHERSVSQIKINGGLDGIENFVDGQTLVFFQQEFSTGQDIGESYNQGWTASLNPWDDLDGYRDAWDWHGVDGWDPAEYVPGYKEWISSKIVAGSETFYSVANQRTCIWTVNIDGNNYVRLTLANVNSTIKGITANTTGYGSNIALDTTDGIYVGMKVDTIGFANTTVVTDIMGTTITVYPAQVSTAAPILTMLPTLNYNNALYVRNGNTHGGINIYYDPYIKEENLVPNFSKIPQQIKTSSTIFDGDGTKFYDYRDTFVTPAQGTSSIKFPHLNVFD